MTKINVTFKTPDVQLDDGDKFCDLSSFSKADQKTIERFIYYNEYVDIEIDLEAKTATVLEVS